MVVSFDCSSGLIWYVQLKKGKDCRIGTRILAGSSAKVYSMAKIVDTLHLCTGILHSLKL